MYTAHCYEEWQWPQGRHVYHALPEVVLGIDADAVSLYQGDRGVGGSVTFGA